MLRGEGLFPPPPSSSSHPHAAPQHEDDDDARRGGTEEEGPAVDCCWLRGWSKSARPPAELKWIAELGFHNLGVQPLDDAKLLTTRQAGDAAGAEAAAAAPPLY